MMLSDAIDEYLAVRKRSVKATTHGNDTKVLKRFLAHVGNIQIKNLKASHVENFFFGEGEDGEPSFYERVQPASFNIVLQHVGLFLRWCERKRYLKRDLLEDVHRRKLVKRERLRLSPGQLIALLDVAACPRDRILIALAENTGMRAGDIVALKVSDVNLAAGRLRTNISKSGVEDSKPISADLDYELRRWLVYYENAEKNTYRQTLQPDWYLVPTQRVWNLRHGRTNEMIHGERFYPEIKLQKPERAVKRALAALGLDGPGEGIHTIRRSVARAYFESLRAQGYDGALQATKAFLNHADASVTEHYLGLTHERQVRDETIAGKPFLSGMVEGENVINIADARRQA